MKPSNDYARSCKSAVIFLGLGSNVGDREKNLHAAVDLLKENQVRIIRLSTIIETSPVGGVPQGDFLNAVLKAETDLNPEELLALCQSIEKKLGRIKTVRNGPRTIDLDILYYAQEKIVTPELIIPHPRIQERDFVLIPLKEIAPDLFK